MYDHSSPDETESTERVFQQRVEQVRIEFGDGKLVILLQREISKR